MISGILSSILGYILTIGFILGFLGGSIYIIICGIRGYLAEEDRFCLFCDCCGMPWRYGCCNYHFKGFWTIIGGYII